MDNSWKDNFKVNLPPPRMDTVIPTMNNTISVQPQLRTPSTVPTRSQKEKDVLKTTTPSGVEVSSLATSMLSPAARKKNERKVSKLLMGL